MRQQTLEAARNAARRSGLPLGQWLDSVISRSASGQRSDGSRTDAPPLQAGPAQDDRDGLSDIKDRLGTLGRQLDRLTGAGPRPAPAQDKAPSLADPPTPLDQALMEIAERQRALDGETLRPEIRAAELPRAPTQGFSHLEQQLREVTARIDSLRPCNIQAAVETLREDLAEIGLMLKEAMPRQAIEALEAEVRALAERVAGTYHVGVENAALNGIEQGLAEVRDALRALTPAENLTGFDGAIAELARKIDQIPPGGRDPQALMQLEGAVAELRDMVSHVASSEALTALSNEVHALAERVEQVAGGGGSELVATIEQRIAALTEALQARNETSPRDSAPLDDRINRLIEKLDASDARMSQLENIEQTLSALVEHLERDHGPSAGAPSNPAEIGAITRDVRRTQDSVEEMHGTLGHLVDRMAIIETGLRAATPQPQSPEEAMVAAVMRAAAPAIAAPSSPVAPVAPLGARATVAPVQAAAPVTEKIAPAGPPPAQERRPIDPTLPPDHPLEPGLANRNRVASPAERIAASEAALRSIKPPVIPDPGERPNFIAAARRAAQAAASAAAQGDVRPAGSAADQAGGKAAGSWGSRVRSLLVGTSVLLIVLGSVHLVTNLLSASREAVKSAPELPSAPVQSANPVQPTDPAEPLPAPEPRVSTPEPEPKLAPAPPSGRQSTLLPSTERSPFPPLPPSPAAVTAPEPDTTEITNTVRAAERTTPQLPRTDANIDALPPQIGSRTLRTAAAKGDAAAEFEVALRYAEGRGVPQDLAKAAEWFDRAANKGVAPAQFRLAGLYEKGLGVPKNLDTARRLYLAAAEAGNAKAMHNLAVLNAEGVDGKPDYPTAAKWFAKAASYGVGDSQYNLGILYARGIGVQPNLPEAYKWFALAARDGDKESARKRDDVATRLDQQSLAAAKLAVQNWMPQPQPDAAVQVKPPAGGWDDAAAPAPAPAPPKRQAVAPKLGMALPAVSPGAPRAIARRD